jgi:hypothetical protein
MFSRKRCNYLSSVHYTTSIRLLRQSLGKGGQLHHSGEDHFPTQGWAAALLKCRQLPNSSVGSFLTQVWAPYIAAVLFVSAQLFYLCWFDAVHYSGGASGPFKWAAVNSFGICLKHNKRFNKERRGVGKLGGGQVDTIMAAEGWWGQYLACGEDSSYLPPPLPSAPATGMHRNQGHLS